MIFPLSGPGCIRPKNHLPIMLYAYTVFVDTNNPYTR